MAKSKFEGPQLSDSIPTSLKGLSVFALSAVILGLSARIGDLLMDRVAEFPELNDAALSAFVGLDPEAKTLCEDGKDQNSAGFEASRKEVEVWAERKRGSTFRQFGLTDQSNHFCRGERPGANDNHNRLTVSDTAFSRGYFAPTWHLTGVAPVEGGPHMKADFEANPYPAFLDVAPYTHSEVFLPSSDALASTTDSSGVKDSIPEALK